jgi:hypothetical protein
MHEKARSKRPAAWGPIGLVAILGLGACDAAGSAGDPDAAVGPRRDAQGEGGSPSLGDFGLPDASTEPPAPDADTRPTGDASTADPDAAVPDPDAAIEPPAPDATIEPPAPDAAVTQPCASEGIRRACPPADLVACPGGVQTCTDGLWGACTGPAERCNGLDDDCDGVADEDLGLDAPCMAGVGACGREGVAVCGENGDVVCQGQPGPPAPEACDGVDNDCDGVIDEDFGLGGPCSAGVGACQRDGAQVCVPGGGNACNAVPGEPAQELCNGLDDDCDGAADDGFALDAPCRVGVGECARAGHTICGRDGAATCDTPPGDPIPELCNGLDDDCDGEVDEDFALGSPCDGGDPACPPQGIIVCDAGAAVCSIRPGAPEICDEIDDDCDGQVDEGLGLGEGCTAGTGVCATVGVRTCDGVGGLACDPVDVPRLGVGFGGDGELIVGDRVELEPDRPYEFTRLEIQAGGVLTVRARQPGEVGRLDLRVSEEVVVHAGGRIDLDAAGEPGGPPNGFVARMYLDMWTNGGGTNGMHGQGPGGGGGGWSSPQQIVGSGGGGGYGTRGADGVRCGQDDRNYTVWDDNVGGPVPIAQQSPRASAGGDAHGDDTLDPLVPGSGGGAGGNNYDGGQAGIAGAGGPGGGALRIVTPLLVVEPGGEISADGGPGEPGVNGAYVGGGGGGSGGAVYLAAVTLRLQGAVSALGGAGGAGQAGSNGGAGGEGRIRLDAAAFDAVVDVRPAAGRQDPLACAP